MSKKSNNAPKAYSYVRMSTEAQLHGDSLRRQLERSQAYAREHGLDLDEYFRLEDLGVSAFKGANVNEGALGRFLNAVNKGEIPENSYLLVESLDRLSRQEVLKSLSIFTAIINAGITIVTLADGRTYTADKTDFAELILSIAVMSRAHEESRTKSYRGTAAWAHKRSQASLLKMTALCPGWLRLSEDRSQYVVIPERADIVRSIFDDCAAGIGSYSIARRLNNAKIPPFGRSAGWQTSYVSKLLTSKAVIGEFQPHRLVNCRRVPEGAPTANYFPRIVDDDLFYRAQTERSLRRTGGAGRKGEKVSNLFSGLAKCSYCNGSMVFINKGMGSKGGTYLVCDNGNRGLGCEKVLWRYEDFESTFLSFVDEIDVKSIFADEGSNSTKGELEDAIQSISGRISDLEANRERTYQLYLQGGEASGFVAKKLEELQQRLAELTKARNEHEARLAGLAFERRLHSERKNELRDLICKLQTAPASQVFKLRSQIAARLRGIVGKILVAPAGIMSLDKADFTDELRDGWLTAEHLDDINDELLNKPDKALGRYFLVEFRDGSSRKISPTPSDPFELQDARYWSHEGLEWFLRLEQVTLVSEKSNVFKGNKNTA